MTKNRLSSQSGFTLLEIMLVVVIIGMLITVAVVRLGGQTERARLVTARRQIDAYKTALGLYDLDNGLFPTQEQGLNALNASPGGTTLPNWKGPYLDPPVLRPDPWGHPYIYRYPGQKITSGYDLFSAGPNGVEGDEDDIGNWQ
jgi:general secretion pathway protein G